MTKTSFNIAYKRKNSYYIVIEKFIYFIGFVRFVFAETNRTSFEVSDFYPNAVLKENPKQVNSEKNCLGLLNTIGLKDKINLYFA